MIKEILKNMVFEAVKRAYPLGEAQVFIEKTSRPEFGDFTTNIALLLAKELEKPARSVAEKIISALHDEGGYLSKTSLAGPGFINFTITSRQWIESLSQIMEEGASYGTSRQALGYSPIGQKIVVEFVSANPTGPLHIGNARGGPLGDVIASLLQATGCHVVREFYVNDVGGQIDKLGISILEHYKKLSGVKGTGEEALGYKGDYVQEIAEKALKHFGPEILQSDEKSAYLKLGQFGMEVLQEEIRRDLKDMGICFDSWVHEKNILAERTTEKIIDELKKKGMTCEKEGALWFAPKGDTPKGDSPNDEFIGDRESVLVRSDGRPTYFANDIAYHAEKYRRGFERLINVWGSNHHGHVSRILSAMKVLGHDPQKISTILYQYVRVKRGNDAVKMSKRGGDFITAREVLDEVGRDAFRFFLLMRSPEAHLDFDIEDAKKQSSENPVYYVQYAHARISSIFVKASDFQLIPPSGFHSHFVENLALDEEIHLAKKLLEYPSVVFEAAHDLAPHRVTYYLLESARLFQQYYDKARGDERYRVVSDNIPTSTAKLFLLGCIRQVLRNGLNLLGLSAPEKM